MTIGFDVEGEEVPLLQNCFIEASAGTGKSYTIKTLVVRLIIEKGLRIDQILVVTFTRVATLELKEAIRDTVKRTLLQVQTGENLPRYLRTYVLDPGRKKETVRRLKGALASMDNAKVVTLHGFALYLLSQYKMTSLVSEESVASQEQLSLLMKDFFRTELSVQELPLWQQELLFDSYHGDFEKLVRDLGQIAETRIPIIGSLPLKERVEEERLRLRYAPHVERLLKEAQYYKGLSNKKREVKEEAIAEFQKFAAWIEGEEREPRFKELFKLLPDNKMQNSEGEHDYTSLILLLEQMNDPLAIFAFVAEKARLYLIKVLEKEPLLFYDDLLSQASNLIEKKEVQEKIRAEFRAAFIDEFQDTDQMQWKIFSTLFLEQNALVVVGDPKQSIYRFRHADLYTYMEAKKSFSHQFSLMTNYRSGFRIVEALNQLCGSVDDFLLLPAWGQSFPCPKIEPKQTDGEDKSSFELWEVESEEQLFHAIAAQIALLQKTEGIKLSECAVLVKDRHQMERCKEAMKKFSLQVYMMREENRTTSPAFALFYDLLEALIEPYDLSKNAKVLLSPLFAVSIDEVEKRQLSLLREFFLWHDLLEERGILAAMEAILDYCGSILLHQEEGKALYRNLMSLASLGAESLLTGRSLLAFYQNVSKKEENETNKTREGEDALALLTIHMSKGLEFRVVFPVGVIASYSIRRQLIYSFENHSYQIGENGPEEEAEKIRLFYVAITRAKEHLYLPYIQKKEKKIDGRSSMIDLFMSKSTSSMPVRSFVGQELPFPSFTKKNALLLKPHFLSWPHFTRMRIDSFSSLYTHQINTKERAEPSFPSSSEVGTLLHYLVEKISFRQSSKRHVQAAIAPLLKSTILSDYIEQVADLLFQSFHLPLKGGFTLADLDEKKMRKEVQFAMLEKEGGMRGVIDLFFSHGDTYYFLDWKSNHLENYSDELLHNEMHAFHYEKQAAIYKKALEKYLSFFDERPFEESFGGYYYLFMRGPAVYHGR